ncbi:phage tail tube protein, partial [Bacillus sp. B-TM1]
MHTDRFVTGSVRFYCKGQRGGCSHFYTGRCRCHRQPGNAHCFSAFLCQIRTPNTADAEDDTYLDDEDADWKTTTQGQKSVGDTSATLAWRPGDSGQKKLVQLFDSGEVCAFRIKYHQRISAPGLSFSSLHLH